MADGRAATTGPPVRCSGRVHPTAAWAGSTGARGSCPDSSISALGFDGLGSHGLRFTRSHGLGCNRRWVLRCPALRVSCRRGQGNRGSRRLGAGPRSCIRLDCPKCHGPLDHLAVASSVADGWELRQRRHDGCVLRDGLGQTGHLTARGERAPEVAQGLEEAWVLVSGQGLGERVERSGETHGAKAALQQRLEVAPALVGGPRHAGQGRVTPRGPGDAPDGADGVRPKGHHTGGHPPWRIRVLIIPISATKRRRSACSRSRISSSDQWKW